MELAGSILAPSRDPAGAFVAAGRLLRAPGVLAAAELRLLRAWVEHSVREESAEFLAFVVRGNTEVLWRTLAQYADDNEEARANWDSSFRAPMPEPDEDTRITLGRAWAWYWLISRDDAESLRSTLALAAQSAAPNSEVIACLEEIDESLEPIDRAAEALRPALLHALRTAQVPEDARWILRFAHEERDTWWLALAWCADQMSSEVVDRLRSELSAGRGRPAGGAVEAAADIDGLQRSSDNSGGRHPSTAADRVAEASEGYQSVSAPRRDEALVVSFPGRRVRAVDVIPDPVVAAAASSGTRPSTSGRSVWVGPDQGWRAVAEWPSADRAHDDAVVEVAVMPPPSGISAVRLWGVESPVEFPAPDVAVARFRVGDLRGAEAPEDLVVLIGGESGTMEVGELEGEDEGR